MLSETATTILERRYLLKDYEGKIIETPDELFRRVADGVAEVHGDEEYADAWYDEMTNLRFLPNSPTLMNAGTGQGTLSACFVLPVEDTMEGIMGAARDAAMVQKFGGGTGFALSRLRPKGAPISSTHGVACGPIAVLKHLSSVSKLVTQGGKRDGANMAVMRVDHPDILEFISSKETEGDIHNFNISVGATRSFMEAVKSDSDYALIDPSTGSESGRLRARDVWNKIIDGAWRNGEPGMVFLDEVNRDHGLLGVGTIEATNPCGEQPLLPNESCNLGSLVLSKFTDGQTFDFEAFGKSIRLAVRFLDNVIDANRYATEAIEQATKRTRKIGLGVMGWADTLIAHRIRYGSPESLEFARAVASYLKEVADDESESLARQRGAYPSSIDGRYRNACRLTVAPTGTISMLADASSGIEPLFALNFTKKNVLATGGQDSAEFVYEHPLTGEVSGDILVTTKDVSPVEHVDMQAAWQEFIDSGVSKTINLPNDATRSDIARAYLRAYDTRCKGITVYRAGSREMEVLVDNGKAAGGEPERPVDECPVCGGGVAFVEGCKKCTVAGCGWSAC